MKFTVYLGEKADKSFDVELINNDFVKKWLDELQWCLDNCEFDYNECFVDFFSIEKRKENLLKAVNDINVFLFKIYKKNYIELPQNINWEDQNFYNYLHLKFEELSGTYGNPTKIFLLAPTQIKQAIKNINYYVHNLENSKKSNLIDIFKIAFDKNSYRRKKFELSDYNFLSSEIEKNSLYLSYSELGKTLYEIYKENLPLNYKNLKNFHYYSGECTLHFSETYDFDKGFYKFCKENKIDLSDKTLGLGSIKLGTIKNAEQVKNLLQNYQFLHSIKIERHNYG